MIFQYLNFEFKILAHQLCLLDIQVYDKQNHSEPLVEPL